MDTLQPVYLAGTLYYIQCGQMLACLHLNVFHVLDYITSNGKAILLYINTKDYKRTHTPLQDDQLGAHVGLLILVRDVIRTAFV